MDPETERSLKLTDAQKARIERNRQKALQLRQSRLASKPYSNKPGKSSEPKPAGPIRVIDTGAGFFIDEDAIDGETSKSEIKVVHQPGAVLAVDNLLCDDCCKEFVESYIYNHFDALICDTCRQVEDRHPLITRTEAKSKYLLKDADLDKREPPLKFVLRKNPHNPRWGDMKLYLESQVWKRVLDVWGSEEKLEEARQQNLDNREKTKRRKFDKRVKELRLAVRTSLWHKNTESHVHAFGEECYDEDEDIYRKTCTSCAYEMTYEKM